MKIKKLIINKFSLYLLVGLLTGITTKNILDGNTPTITHTKEITSDDLNNFINNSNDLKDDEKDYLYNSDFFKDVLSTINASEYMKKEYQKKFKNIVIKSFEADNIRKGFYNPCEPNCLYVAEYSDLDFKTKDTVAHEFVHLCQCPCKYTLLIEASAEIISNEYFNSTSINSYQDEVKILKVLMEIIGSKPIWDYVFTGDFSKIEEEVKPYLKGDEYKEFLRCLVIERNDGITRKIYFKRLNELLNIIYFNKFKVDIKNDLVVSLIRNKPEVLSRYYFNQRLINDNSSFYYNFKNESIPLDEAEKNGYIVFYNNELQIPFTYYNTNKNNPDFSYISFTGEVINNTFIHKVAEKIYIPTINERLRTKEKIYTK